jgi:hypothetical protein
MPVIVLPPSLAPRDAINTTSRGDVAYWRGLSPFFLGPISLPCGRHSINVENAWQYSKVYPEHDDGNEPTQEWYEWSAGGFSNPRAQRYPMGRDARPAYTWFQGHKLGYVEAKLHVYTWMYATSVAKTVQWEALQASYQAYPRTQFYPLVDFDAHHYARAYRDGRTWRQIMSNPELKFGHGMVLAAMLEGEVDPATGHWT